MKKVQIVLVMMLLAAVLASCGEKKKNKDIIAPRVVKVVPKAPIRMQDYADERGVAWIGRSYQVAISRTASDSLPMVKDENGQQFVDNVFRIVVRRADGSVFFNRTFTKASVMTYLDENYRKNGVFEGLVFDRADGDWLVFAGSVGLPQTDEYIPLVIRLSRMGELQIQRDSQMDTANPIAEQELSSEEI